MMNWSLPLFDLWLQHAPWLLLLAFALLFVTGYPIAFSLGALTLLFGWAGVQSQLIELASLARIPDHLFSHILLDPALLSLPLLLFFAELLVESGQMEGVSRAIKGMFEPFRLIPQAAKKRRGTIHVKSRAAPNEEAGQRSIFMAIFLPGAILTILLARLFGLSPEYLSIALFVPTVVLFLLYLINWLLDLWVEAHRRRVKRLAAWSDLGIPPADRYQAGKIFGFLILPIILVGIAFALLLHYRVSLFATLAVLSLVLSLQALLQGKLKLGRFLSVANRASIATGNLCAMLLAGFCFHSVFIALGGGTKIEFLTNLAMPLGTLPWLPLFVILIGFALLGMVFDWIVLAFVVLPILTPLISKMDFSALLDPIWQDMAARASSINSTNSLLIQGQTLQSRLWLAALVWLALITSLVTYCRQSGEIVAKTLAHKASKKQNARISMGLFLLLQLLGLTAAIIVPQTVLWLPSLLIG